MRPASPPGCWIREPPGPPASRAALGSSALVGVHTVRTLPLRGGPSTPRAPRWRSFSFPLFSPCSVPSRPAPWPCAPRLLSRSPGLLRSSGSLRSGTGLPAPRPALPCSPRRPLLRAPLRSFPLETSSALGPSASSLLQTRPFPCSAPACGTLTPAGEESQHTSRQETTVTVLFLQGQVYLLSERQSWYVDGNSQSLLSNFLPVFAELAI